MIRVKGEMLGATKPDILESFTSEMDTVRNVLDRVRKTVARSKVHRSLNDVTQVVLAEVLNNVVEHAYKFEPGHPMELKGWFRRDELTFEIRDQGVAMPNGSVPCSDMPDINPGARDTLPEGGFGWSMIHTLVNNLTYVRRDGQNYLSFSFPATDA